jgi:hypothetical protein
VVTFTPDINNEMFQLAVQLVNQSNRNIFLTGKAGTGKTTFLKYIRENCHKQMAVVAPTGVAAINAGGVTIHSFFNLPFSPFIPEVSGHGFSENNSTIDRHSLISHLRFNSEKKKVFQQLELLVIDEISMVRCDTLDAVDTVLRHIRQKPQDIFGGVQLLFIGDMLQLPPVIKEQEWNLLSEYYSGQYFFDSKVLQQNPPVNIEFNKIYRQTDEQFIGLLNQVRNNEIDEEGIKILEKRYQPNFRRSKQDGYIVLTTHNDKAREINARELENLSGKHFSYEAEVQDEFSERAFPADVLLHLKVGAQVMFIKNDSAEKGKRYFNGKIGVVSALEEEKIIVKCEDEPDEIEVQKEKWENIRYTLNKTTRQLDSDVLGSFTQYPLRLAWAITIHKSQGLTFEKAIIDAGAAFAPGQVYVALSRCTSLEGMILQSHIKSSSLFNDKRIVEFSKQNASGGELQQELALARTNYQQSVLLSIFDYSPVLNSCKELQEYLVEHHSSFNPGSISWTEELISKIEKLQDTAKKFQLQIKFLFQQKDTSNENKNLQQRINAASNYFLVESGLLIRFLHQSPAITDSRIHSKEYNENIREIFAALSLKNYLLEIINNKFDIDEFHRRRQGFVLPTFSVNAYAGVTQKRFDSPHPILHQQLRILRDKICSKKDLPIYIVAGSNTIDEMARYLPQTLSELRKISGFGDAKIAQYGQQFLDVIISYCKERNLTSLISEKSPKRERKKTDDEKKVKVDTKNESFKIFKNGKSVKEIADERKLTVQTVEGHLAYYILLGEIKISDLVSREKIELIESALKKFQGDSITSIKEKLGSNISFGEIKLVLASLQFNKNSTAHKDH